MGAAQDRDAEGSLKQRVGQGEGGCFVGDDPALAQHHEPVAEAGGQGEVVQDGDDAGASAADRAQEVHRVELVGRVEGGDRLVGEQDLGLDREGAGEQHPHPLARRQARLRSLAQVGDVGARHRPGDRRVIGLARACEGTPVRQASEGDHLRNAHRPADPSRLDQDGEAACPLVPGDHGERPTVEEDAAG